MGQYPGFPRIACRNCCFVVKLLLTTIKDSENILDLTMTESPSDGGDGAGGEEEQSPDDNAATDLLDDASEEQIQSKEEIGNNHPENEGLPDTAAVVAVDTDTPAEDDNKDDASASAITYTRPAHTLPILVSKARTGPSSTPTLRSDLCPC
jgi:hypothetical protein